jgi:hypothetical protein
MNNNCILCTTTHADCICMQKDCCDTCKNNDKQRTKLLICNDENLIIGYFEPCNNKLIFRCFTEPFELEKRIHFCYKNTEYKLNKDGFIVLNEHSNEDDIIKIFN